MAQLQRFLLLLLIASLAVPFPIRYLFGQGITATDVLFVMLAAAWLVRALLGNAPRLGLARYWPVLCYVACITLAAVISPNTDPIRLIMLGYLVALAILVGESARIVSSEREPVMVWISAGMIPAIVGVVALALFAIGFRLDFALHPFGTLQPGPYPRLQSTFVFPAMLTNYLTVCAVLLSFARHRLWLGPRTANAMLGLLFLCSLFTFTPGLGGMALAIGAWMVLGEGRSRWWLAGASALFLCSLFAAALTPIAHPSADWSFNLLGHDLYPSVRMLTWSDALRHWSNHWLAGNGLSGGPVSVDYLDPSGIWHHLTDAHNIFLNTGAQTGLLGLAGLLILIFYVGTGRIKAERGSLLQALSIAWLAAFVAEGLTGSYEDARHLWALLGLIFAAAAQRRQAIPATADP